MGWLCFVFSFFFFFNIYFLLLKWDNVSGKVLANLELSEKGAVSRSRGVRNHKTAMEVVG